ncbi:MAG: BatD family protein [Spirochaetes bacterium]|nr:BatD family protein [Spirochaetota bacterium]
MKRESLKNTGRILLCAVIALIITGANGATQLETEIDETSIEVGYSTTLRVRLSGDAEGIKPVRFPSIPGLKIEYSGMQQSYEYINGRSWSGVKLLFSVTALKKGRYRIPPLVLQRGSEKFVSREVALTVTAGSSGNGGESAIADIKSSVELSSGTSYVGQPVIMRYYLLAAGLRAEAKRFNEFPDTKGFAIKMIDDPSAPGDGQEGEYNKNHIATFALIPAGTGSYRVGGGSALLSVEMPSRGRMDEFFGMNFPGFTRTQLLTFDVRPVTILPLPGRGRPDAFQGDIGNFTIRADIPGGDVEVYDEKKIVVTVEGAGNLVTMNKPALSREVPGLKVISEEGESSITIDGGTLRGSRTFIYTLVPEKPGRINPGRFMLSFFNPEGGSYKTVQTDEISFVAKGNGAQQEGRYDEEKDKHVDFNPLYAVLIVFTLAAIIVFVVIWERQRYRLVAHGEKLEHESEDLHPVRPEQDYHAEAARCIDRGDGEGFLKAAEKSLELAQKGVTGGSLDKMRDDVTRIKEEIYAYKFGRGTISADDMKRILREIEDVKGLK